MGELMAIAVDDPAFAPGRRWRRKAIHAAFQTLAHLGNRVRQTRLASKRLDLIQDVAYGEHRFQRLDIYRPHYAPRPLPVLLYIHGGAFTVCSKETHRGIGIANASGAQYLVLMIDYRLAPRFRFPAAHEDACSAYVWAVENVARYGGDPTRIVVAGESAGGNLALSVAIAASYRRPEPWARAVFDCGVSPAAVQPIMPYLQVSNPARQAFNPSATRLAVNVAHEIAMAYLGANRTQAATETQMADPIRVLEEGGQPARPLPPVFSGVGTDDLCCEDVRRLERACRRLRVPATLHYYDNEIHAFHVMRWRSKARSFWRENFRFLQSVALETAR
jgi:acetyl esterase